MWEFRRDPKDLTAEGQQRLEELFQALPRLRQLYDLRVRFKVIFDTATDRRKASRQLVEVWIDALAAFPELERFVAKRMGTTTVETASSHVLMLFSPGLVLDMIRKAFGVVQKA